jgi:hypothetical protein
MDRGLLVKAQLAFCAWVACARVALAQDSYEELEDELLEEQRYFSDGPERPTRTPARREAQEPKPAPPTAPSGAAPALDGAPQRQSQPTSQGRSVSPRESVAQDAGDQLGFGEARFADDAPAAAKDAGTAVTAEAPLPLTFGGRYRLRTAFSLAGGQTQPLAQARNLLGLWMNYSSDFQLLGAPGSVRMMAAARLEFDPTYLDRREYDAPTREQYALRLIREETSLAVSLGPCELQTGFLKMPLGQGEALGTIALNPRDLRDPGMTDPDDLLLAVLATRLSLSFAQQRFEIMVVHESNFNLRAAPLGRFSPMRKLLLEGSSASDQLEQLEFRYRDEPRPFDPHGTQALGRYRATVGAFELELYAGSMLEPIGLVQLPTPAELEQDDVRLLNYHPRYTKLAHAGAATVGPVLIRWELTADLLKPLSIRDNSAQFPSLEMERLTQVGALFGFTYFGPSGLNISLEQSKSYILDNPERATNGRRSPLLPVESVQLAMRASYVFYHERLQLTVIGALIGIERFNGAFATADLRIVLAANTNLAFGGVIYLPGSEFGPFYGFEANNRAYVELRWDFALL